MEVSEVFLIPSGDMKDGKTVEEMLEGTKTLERLKMALQIFNGTGYIIVSGGHVKGSKFSHAEIMREWLISKGIPTFLIYAEKEALDSYQNIIFSNPAIRTTLKQKDKTQVITIVTEENHARRMLITARACGWKYVRVAIPDYDLTKSELILEKALYLMHRIDPLGKWPLAKLNRWLRR